MFSPGAMKLALIIPAHNEEKRILGTLEAYAAFLDRRLGHGGIEYEILVVINNTSDGTEAVVRRFAEGCGRVRYLNLEKGGKGFAVMEGFKAALSGDADLLGFVDADMATPPRSFQDLIDGIGTADATIACRYMPGSIITPRYSFRRTVVAKCFNALVRGLLGLPFRDTQCGAKLFKRATVLGIIDRIGMSQWAFDVEVLYRIHESGGRIREMPTEWIDVAGSKLKLPNASLGMLFAVARLRIEISIFRGILKPLEPVFGFVRKLLQ